MSAEFKRVSPTVVEVDCTGGCGVTFSIPFTEDQQRRWEAGELLQRVIPAVHEDRRELLISGTCGDCWETLFGDDKEDIEGRIN